LVDVAGPGDLPSAAETELRDAASHQLAAGEADHGPLDLASEGAAASRALDEAAEAVGGETASSPASSAAPGSSGDRLDGTSGPQVRVIDSAEAEPVDLLDAAGAPVVKRAAPVVAGLTFLWLASIFLRRRRKRRRAES
jgi:hypothetical protein